MYVAAAFALIAAVCSSGSVHDEAQSGKTLARAEDRVKANDWVRYKSVHTAQQSFRARESAAASEEDIGVPYVPNTYREQDKCVIGVVPNADGGGLTLQPQMCELFNPTRREERQFLLNIMNQVNAMVKDTADYLNHDDIRMSRSGSGRAPLFRVLVAYGLRNKDLNILTTDMRDVAARLLATAFAIAPKEALPSGRAVNLAVMTKGQQDMAQKRAIVLDGSVVYNEVGALYALESIFGSIGMPLSRERQVLFRFLNEQKEANDAAAKLLVATLQTTNTGKGYVIDLVNSKQWETVRDIVLRHARTCFALADASIFDKMWRYVARPTTTLEDVMRVVAATLATHVPLLRVLPDNLQQNYIAFLPGTQPILTPPLQAYMDECLEKIATYESRKDKVATKAIEGFKKAFN